MRIDRSGVHFGAGFAFVMLVAVVLTFAGWLAKNRPDLVRRDPIVAALDATRQEWFIRNMQDPLTQRLWVVEQFGWQTDSYQTEAIQSVLDQWAAEVKALGTNAFRGMPANLSLDGLGLTPDQRKTVDRAVDQARAALEAGEGSQMKTW